LFGSNSGCKNIVIPVHETKKKFKEG